MARGKKKEAATLPGLEDAGAASAAKPIEKFHHSLALSRWALKIFQGHSLDPLRAILNRREMEGVDAENGHTKFFNAVVGSSLFDLGDASRLSKAQLAVYDLRVVGYWQQITAGPQRRDAAGNPVTMKYYQWLSLMVTELYLDWYFNRKAQLLAELNAEITEVNAALPAKERLAAATLGDLDKISFWEATGSGKTLLMHVNILQYKWYAAAANRKLTRVIVLTPNEGLSEQHLKELKDSGFAAAPLADDLTKNDTTKVGVVDSNKLSSKGAGVKVMAAESFEGANLVLVDEGHHGASVEDSEHRKVRDMLSKDGFAFEYSATFGQAVASGNKKDARTLWDLYARNILFDYSYRYFFDDGYGKEALILNLDERGDTNPERRFEYLVGNLLAFYQQHRIFATEKATMEAFGVAEPLCLFVGNTVNAKKNKKTGAVEMDEAASDVREVIWFLADVLNRRTDVEKLIRRYVADEPVVQIGDRNPFAKMFEPLMGVAASELYDDLLRHVFRAQGVQMLHLKHIKKRGEIALSVGQNPVFGVVNIGDCSAFLSAADGGTRYTVDPADDFDDRGYFATLNDVDSTVTILIGSRKFTEGWSSWRVSAMGLLNMGVSEGTQIIQLFGRGVRLRGRNYSLKRSTKPERPKGSYLRKLETLNVFGIRANYMARFKEYLELEIGRRLDSVLTLDFTPKHSLPLGLRIPKVADGYALNQAKGFKAQRSVTLFVIPDEDKKRIKMPRYVHEDFAYLQVLRVSERQAEDAGQQERNAVTLDKRAFPFFDLDRIYLRMIEEKACKGFRNLVLSRAVLQRVVDDIVAGKDGAHDWYELYSRPSDVTFDSFSKLKNMEQLFTKLVLGYMEVFYRTFQNLYEDEHMEVVPLTEDILNGGGNFQWPQKYQFEFEDDPAAVQWKARLEELQKLVEGEDVPAKCSQWSAQGTKDFVAIAFDQLLYEPVFYARKGARLPFKMKPISFDAPSEKRFLEDLLRFYNNSANANFFKDLDFYLMRNSSHKSRGLGFAQAGNFYPDFLIWMRDKTTGKEYLGFVDPKGLRNVSFESPKLNFAKEVKTLQATVNVRAATPLIMNSVILSETPYAELNDLFASHTKVDYEAKNVFFLNEGNPAEGEGGAYLPKMFAALKTE